VDSTLSVGSTHCTVSSTHGYSDPAPPGLCSTHYSHLISHLLTPCSLLTSHLYSLLHTPYFLLTSHLSPLISTPYSLSISHSLPLPLFHLRFPVNEIKPPAGSHVTVHIEIHNIAIFLHVVAPFELKIKLSILCTDQ
jgi:hypothetical protein